MQPLKRKTRSGEAYEHTYMTTFTVPLMKGDGSLTMVRAKIECPRSDYQFYATISNLLRQRAINPFMFVTAERQLFLEGFTRVD